MALSPGINNTFLSILFFLSGMVLCTPISSQNLQWANSLAGKGVSSPGNLSPGTSICEDIDVDDQNNVYICGYLNDSADFDPGPSTFFLQGGNNDVFFAKYSATGNLIWARVIKSNGGNYAKGIVIDKSHNVVITGHCQSDADFDPGNGTALLTVSPGNSNYFFIAKYDSAGNYIWAKGMEANYGVQCFDLVIDNGNNLYITGTMYDSLDFDAGPALATFGGNGSGVFLAKYDSSGNFIWVNCLSGIGQYGGASSLACADDGKLLVAGYFGNTVDFDSDTGTHYLTATTSADRFFARYDNNGKLIWAKSINVNNNGVLSAGRCIDIKSDHSNNSIITGDYTGNADMDAGPGQTQLSSPSTYSTFICKYDSLGNFMWAKGIKGNYCVPSDLAMDCFDNIYVTGIFYYADFDPGPAAYMDTSSAASAFMNYIAKYDVNGNFIWERKIGNNGYGSGIISSVLSVRNSEQYVGGAFKQSGDFDPDTTTKILTATGVGHNSFFAKYSSEIQIDIASDTMLCQGQSLLVNSIIPNANYQWQNNSGIATTVAGQTEIYVVTMKAYECISSDTVFIQTSECANNVQMPNVFSPNGDGVNDYFLAVQTEGIAEGKLFIYNRWGQKLFESSNFTQGWDGKSNGKICVDGTYFWMFEYTSLTNKPGILKGYLELIR